MRQTTHAGRGGNAAATARVASVRSLLLPAIELAEVLGHARWEPAAVGFLLDGLFLRSLWYGQLSAVIEPLAAVARAATVLATRPLLPYALAVAAGAMIYVIVEELIPESQQGSHGDLATVATGPQLRDHGARRGAG